MNLFGERDLGVIPTFGNTPLREWHHLVWWKLRCAWRWAAKRVADYRGRCTCWEGGHALARPYCVVHGERCFACGKLTAGDIGAWLVVSNNPDGSDVRMSVRAYHEKCRPVT